MIFDLLGLPALTKPGSLKTYTDLLVLFTAFRLQIMPQFNLTVNNMRGIIISMSVTKNTLHSLPEFGESQIVSGSSLRLNLSQPPKKFYRHGWQSWTLTTWLDPSD